MGAGVKYQALPHGGREIAELRAIGKRPADLVLVSLIGPLHGESNPVVIASLRKTYDWRFLTRLEVLVVAKADSDPMAVRRLLDDLKALPVRYLGIWMVDRQQGRNLVVGGVVARPNGLLRYLDPETRKNFTNIGRVREKELSYACD